MLVAVVALISSLTGGALAAALIDTGDIQNGAVTKKKLHKNAVNSKKVKNKTLKAKDFADGQLAQGVQGIPGLKGDKGEKGDKGDPGADATRLWASVNNDATPAILHGSGVTAVAVGGFTGQVKVSFDRDVSECSFQATVLGHGGGSLNPVVTAAITTGFYPASGLESNQVYVQTYVDSTRDERDFDVAAFC
jgi:hypothetical protein